MDALRVALAQVNPTVGDLSANAALVVHHTLAAAAQGAHVVVFARGALTGYPLHDLALRPSFQRAVANRLDDLAVQVQEHGAGEVAVVVGCLVTDAHGRATDGAAVLQGGAITHRWPGPGDTGGEPGAPALVTVGGHRLAVALGTQHAAPAPPSADGVLVLDAEPFGFDRAGGRREQVSSLATRWGCPLVWVNLVGGQDEMVFDGGSVAVDGAGRVIGAAARFTEQTVVVDLGASDDDGPPVGGDDATERGVAGAEITALYRALVLGLGDHVDKNGFGSVVLGSSGGIDSALLAAIAVDALGPQRVVTVSMPSAYSSQHSRDDAADLAERLGLPRQHHRTVPIEPYVEAFRTGLGLAGVAEENLQARVRGLILMALSNSEGHLVLAPGNKSELAVGYSTIYGDAVGGYAPLKDVVKSRVWQLARDRNARARAAGQVEPIPEAIITKEPSAELRPGQRDADSLPDYHVLDPLLQAYIERRSSREQLLDQGFEAPVVDRILTLVQRAEWKRRQYPLGPQVTPAGFGYPQQMPVINAFTEHEHR